MSAGPPLERETPHGAAILGKGVLVKGEIHSGEPLTIEGEVEGTINMPEHRLTIAGSAKVRANVKAREIEVHGAFDGHAEVREKTCIRNGAQFNGDIHSGSIVVEDGGYIKGSVDLSRNSRAEPKA
jgi:cytoskeletal protein CcmA (bactofilin family)